jgi:cysteine sulfinate desulfinase/cysteine desulfurase-like protein
MPLISSRLTLLTQSTEGGLKSAIPDIKINGMGAKRLPDRVNVTVLYAAGEAMMH